MDENDEGAMVAMVTTENASEVTVSGDGADYFEVAEGNLKLKDGMSLDFESRRRRNDRTYPYRHRRRRIRRSHGHRHQSTTSMKHPPSK